MHYLYSDKPRIIPTIFDIQCQIVEVRSVYRYLLVGRGGEAMNAKTIFGKQNGMCVIVPDNRRNFC